jgi:putative hydrolase of HD superfamily
MKKTQVKKDKTKEIANFLFEVGILNKTPRSGFHFLGTGHQSVAEHMCRSSYVGYVLAMMHGGVDVGKVMKMCLLHDLAESRVSDLNYVHQKYTERHEEKAIKDLTDSLPFGSDMLATIDEYEERKSIEAQLAKDADNIEWLLSLKEEVDIGNKRAATWIPSSVKRLKTKEAKTLAEMIIQTQSDDWWFSNKDDEWWVTRNKKK